MAIISFWTETEKEIGQTSSIIAVATQMAMEHNSKILLITTNNDEDLKRAFTSKVIEEKRQGLFSALKQGGNKSTVGINNGMDGIAMVMQSNKLAPEQITDYTRIVFKNRLEVLGGTNLPEEDYRKTIVKHYPDLIKKANMYYDYVFVDLSRENSDITQEILNSSTIIAYGIIQKSTQMDALAESLSSGFISKRNNVIPYLGRYDRYSKFSLKNITREYKIKKMGAIPYNTLFMESCDEGLVAEYFMRMSTVKGPDTNLDFINDIRKFIDIILYKEQELKMHMGRN